MNSEMKKSVIFYTYTEAQEILQHHSITSSKAYHTARSCDKKLPEFPKQFYKDEWLAGSNGWKSFCGRGHYATYDEAKLAAQALNIKTHAEFKGHYRCFSR